VPSPAGIDGISYLPTLLGKPQKQHEHLYWEFYERGFTQAARMGDWKAVRNGPGKPLEIFNLRGDPGEQHELAASHPEIVARMEQIIKTAHTPSDIWPVKRPPA
jgi:arylsulfatase A-like enzyme